MKANAYHGDGRRGVVTLFLLVLLAVIAIYATANALVLSQLKQQLGLLDARQQMKYR